MMKKWILYSLFVCYMNATVAQQVKRTDARMLSHIQKHKPSAGAVIPAGLKNMIGATHVGGKYYFTDEPYIIEGSKKLYELGMGVCKLWFYKNPTEYEYNASWNLPKNLTLTQLAKHPYYQQAFAVPFSTIVLSTSAGVNMLKADSAGLANEEQEFYDLTLYLLEQYKDRELNFILENWEGDWILRGGFGWDAQWGRTTPPADLQTRLESMRKVFSARQSGVNRARKKVSTSKCKVYHAIEVNKVIDAMYGVPSLTNDVLPYVEVDMVSWSAYDATDFDKTGLDLYRGIDYIKSKMKPTAYVKDKIVFLGEIGIPEMSTKNLPVEFKERWDTYLAVCFAQKVSYIIHWELYCNEAARNQKIVQPAFTKSNEDLNGFWLIKPDGTKGYAMEYFEQLLKYAGGKLPESATK